MRQDPMWAAKPKIFTIWPFTHTKNVLNPEGKEFLTPSTNSSRNGLRDTRIPEAVTVAREVGGF